VDGTGPGDYDHDLQSEDGRRDARPAPEAPTYRPARGNRRAKSASRPDPENLRIAFAWMKLANELRPVRRDPGVRKFSSWDERCRLR
jgi:hypothetical protein